MTEKLQERFSSSGFVKGRLHATRIEGFPRVERAVESYGKGADAEEASEFRVVVRLVECRWQADETAPAKESTTTTTAPGISTPARNGTATSNNALDRSSSFNSLRRRKSDRVKVKVMEPDSDPETELNMYTDEIVMGYFCRFASDTLSVHLSNKPNHRMILNQFRKRVQPLWVLWLRNRISKARFIAHICKLYDNEVHDADKVALVSLFSTWYLAFCRSKGRVQPVDSSLNLIDQWR